jgi:hypothetical protein
MEFDREHGTILRRVTFQGDHRVREVEALAVRYGSDIDDGRFPPDPRQDSVLSAMSRQVS